MHRRPFVAYESTTAYYLIAGTLIVLALGLVAAAVLAVVGSQEPGALCLMRGGELRQFRDYDECRDPKTGDLVMIDRK